MKTIKLLSTLFIGIICLFLVSSNAFGETITYQLNIPEYSIAENSGLHSINMEGCGGINDSGNPQLPAKAIQIALPPDVINESVTISLTNMIEQKIEGEYNIEPAKPIATHDAIIEGDGEAYTKDEEYPNFCVKSNGMGQMREWKFINVIYVPISYNPITKELTEKKGLLEISFSKVSGLSMLPSFLTSSTQGYGVLDDLAQERFSNFSEAKSDWYMDTGFSVNNLFGTQQTHDYVIITTEAIKAGSAQLAAFKAFRESPDGGGHSVLIITEADYGSLVGVPPNGKAEKIRKWLQDNYMAMGIEYVLLIGDPDPDSPEYGDTVGDVPMKMSYPCLWWYPPNKECPTDHYYADLTGDWDINGNGYFGDEQDCAIPGGVDFAAEVYVGRIPVYAGGGEYEDPGPLNNGGFETGDFSGWSKYVPPGGSATVVTSHAGDAGTTYGPVSGNYFAELKTDGPGSYTQIYQSVGLAAGDTLIGHAAFDYRDYHPYNDNAHVVIFDSSNNYVASPWHVQGNDVPDHWDGPWTNWSFTAPVTDIYTVVYFVANEGDSVADTYALFDIAGAIPKSVDYTELDKILEKTINYAPATWDNEGKNVLLPMEPSDGSTPGYHLGDQIKNHFAVPNGFGYRRVYDLWGAEVPERFPCTYTNVSAEWSVPPSTTGPFGLVTWWTHGNQTVAADIWHSGMCPTLDDTHPSMTFQDSCLNGYPEVTDNLAYSLLKNGAISTVAGTRVTWYLLGEKNYTNTASNAGHAYRYSGKIIDSELPCGMALAEVRQECRAITFHPAFLMNHMGFNLYGDPMVSLAGGIEPNPADLDGDSDVDWDDFNIFLGAFGACKATEPARYLAKADFDIDGCITFIDYQTWYLHYIAYITP